MTEISSNWKEEWIKALRSGEFKQGKSALYDKVSDSYCCLGVLCKINNLEESGFVFKCYSYKNSHSSTELPYYFRKELNISATIQARLAGSNDDGCAFPEIADIIESTDLSLE